MTGAASAPGQTLKAAIRLSKSDLVMVAGAVKGGSGRRMATVRRWNRYMVCRGKTT